MYQPSTSRSRRFSAAARVTGTTALAGALAAAGTLLAMTGPVTATAPPADSTSTSTHLAAGNADRCVSIRPESGFYEGGRVGTEELTTPTSRCTTISVSNVFDPANPADRCQTFRLGFWPLVDGSLTYTEAVTACGRHRTVLARYVPNAAQYIVIYDVDYIDPVIQTVNFRVWH